MLRALVYAYVIGGITFVPLVLIALCLVIYLSSPYTTSDLQTSVKTADDVEGNELDPTTIHESYKVGWLTIRSKYTANATDGTYVGMVMQGYRSLMDNKKGQERRPKDVFFAVLRHDTLLLYESEDQIGCKQIIKLSLHDVDIYPQGLEDGELFLKRNAIRLKKKGEALQIADDKDGSLAEYYIFHASPSEKEDWYFALVAAQHLGLEAGGDSKSELDSQSLRHLLMTLQSNELQKDVAWLNGIIGRIFLALHQTRFAEDYFVDKLMRKISRVKKPSFLSDISVRKVNVGSTIPYFTKPKLLDLGMDGTLTGECNVSYAGNFRIEIQTVASLNLSTKLKPMNVTLVLAVVLKQWHGRMKVLIKPQPSNRIWFGFHSMPKIDIAIEPIVSSRQIRYPVILKAIEARINEMIVDSIVLPNMDDIPFFPTLDEQRRGGIWSSTRRKDEDTVKTTDVSGLEDETLDTSSLPSQDKEDSPVQSSVSSPGTNDAAERTEVSIQHRRGWFSRGSTIESLSSRGHLSNNNVHEVSRNGADKFLPSSKQDSNEAKMLTEQETGDSAPKHIKETVKQKAKNLADNAQTKYQESMRGLMVVPAPDNEDDVESDSSSIPAINLESNVDDSSLETRPNLSQSVVTATSAVRRWGVNMYQRRKSRSQEAAFASPAMDSTSNSWSLNPSESQRFVKGSDQPKAVNINSRTQPLRVQPGVELSTGDKKHSDALKLLANTADATVIPTVQSDETRKNSEKSSSVGVETMSLLQEFNIDTGSEQPADLASISSAPAIGSTTLPPAVAQMPGTISISSKRDNPLLKARKSDSDLSKPSTSITSDTDALARPPPIYSASQSHTL